MNARAAPIVQQSWAALRRYTPARIALGRAGNGVPTQAHLAFQAAHARARDAVHAGFDVETFADKVASSGCSAITVRSAAADRQAYLRFPDLGRTLGAESKARLSEPLVAPDVVIVIGDGLSSVAVERNAFPVLRALWGRLQERRYEIAPVVVALQARVALADQIGEVLQARLSVMMIGERPGLSAADSLGMYLTYAPRVGRLDSERNCISNIHANGMSAEVAAAQACRLIDSMFTYRVSGVALAQHLTSSTPDRAALSTKHDTARAL
ncbi:MAG: ethanolamine ammonia-lyase subunit EutC [Xanthobacteraceae bacterium]